MIWFYASLALMMLLGCGGTAPAGQQPAAPAPASTVSAPTATSAADPAATSDTLLDSRARIPIENNDPQWGNPLAPVTIVEFSDFECPFCSRVQPTLAAIRAAYGPEQVRLVWKHNPLPFHQAARPAHVASATVLGLAGHEAFWKFHDLAFSNQSALVEASFEQWAVAAGVERSAFKQAYESNRYAPDVNADVALASAIGISGAPAFRINGVTVSGAQPVEVFKEVIDAQLADAKRLIDAGTPRQHVYAILTDKNLNAAPAEAPALTRTEEEPHTTVYNVPVLPGDPQRGPRDALVTIIVFSEYQCPFCKRVEPTLSRILAEYPKDVRLIWKDNPLPFHPRALPAAHLARYAQATQGDRGFWAAHDALFESQPKLEDEDFRNIATKLGLNWQAANEAIRKERFKKQIEAGMDLALDFSARGTPSFFINGRALRGAQPYEKFQALIEETRSAAAALVATGVPRSKVYEAIVKQGEGPALPERKEVPAPGPESPARGAAHAKIVIQMWSDFQCPFCKRVGATLKELESVHGKDIKVVWRNLPLPFHAQAPLAAEAAQEVFVQKGNPGFWAYHDKLFEVQTTPDGLKRENLERLAEELGVSMPEFKSALDSGRHRARVEADAKLALDNGIRGTPSFVINGYYLSGAQPARAFTKLIRLAQADLRGGDARSKAKK